MTFHSLAIRRANSWTPTKTLADFPRAVGRAFTSRVRDLTENSPALQEVTGHLLAVYEKVIAEEAKLDRKLETRKNRVISGWLDDV